MNDQVEVAVEEAPDTVDYSPAITGRRLLRWTAIVGTAIVVVLACWQDPSYAHDGVRLTLHTDGKGSVWVDTTWQDGHPVGEPVTATLSAREKRGTTVRPVALTGQGTGSARYAGTLTEGVWTVTVDVAKPGAGTCTAVLTAGAQGRSEAVSCDDTVQAGAGGGAAAGSDGSVRVLLIGAAVVGVLFAATAAVLLRRRRS